MDPLLLVRRVPAHRLAVTRRVTARWGTPAASGVQWWELVDPACDDEHPAAALAAVRLYGTTDGPADGATDGGTDGATVRLVGLAAPPGRQDLAVQVLQGLVDALRAGSARRLAAVLPPHGHDLLRQAGFQPMSGGPADVRPEDCWALDL